MTSVRYLLRNLLFYRRTHAGVLLGALLAAAILTGSLAVGDSVRHSLRRIALERLGATQAALLPGGHFFREALAADLAARAQGGFAPLILLRGMVALPDGTAQANGVQVAGVDERFWKIGGCADPLAGADEGACVVNERLAARLGLKQGETVVVRVEEPALLSRDAPLAGGADASVALRLRVHAVAGAAQFGHFGLQANQVPPLTVFVPLRALQQNVHQPGRANTLLAGGTGAEAANAALRNAWALDDLNLELRQLPEGEAELRTGRAFLEQDIAAAAQHAAPDACGVLAYLVNEIRLGDRATPYSIVAAADGAPGVSPIAENEIAINAWLAEDLGAKPGDTLALRYYVMAEDGRLAEKTRQFTVRAVLPLERADTSWMPPFPGVADVENCREWHPGLPMDMSRIRPKDEDYWNRYRGTPKAFIALRAGQAIWSNRFGDLTAVRYPAEAGKVEPQIRNAIDPTRAGLAFAPVRAWSLAASGGAQDFGGLFAGFSFFLVIAALLLMTMLFVFSLEQRTSETGLLLALGFNARRVRGWLRCEGMLLAGLGTLAGTAAGALYARAALHGLATVWRGAVHLSEFTYHCEPRTLLLGAGLSFGAAALAMTLCVRGQARRTAAELLACDPERESGVASRTGRRSIALGALSVAGTAATLACGGRSAEAFFGAGALLLVAGIALSHALLLRLARTEENGGLAQSIAAIGVRGAARRRGRSLTTVAVLAAGVFMVAAVGVFREDPLAHAGVRGSGTGGFAFYGETALPVYGTIDGAVPLRMNAGDDASCLNLNRARQPGFFGVQPGALAARRAFTFVSFAPGAAREAGWELLETPQPGGAVPAIGDEATVRWGLGKAVGDILTCTDERGNPFPVRIVGVIANSVLQGRLVLSENDFVTRFPSASGSRAFLADAPPEQAAAVEKTLRAALQDRGLDLVPAWRRLAEFQAVESSYLRIFEALGGLGLLLGSAGLGIVVLRNVLERRGELALLLALGFSRRTVRWLVGSEHWFLVALGLGIGGIAAGVAVLPSVLAPGMHASPVGPLCTLALLAALGAGWSGLAAWAALRGPLLDALRSE